MSHCAKVSRVSASTFEVEDRWLLSSYIALGRTFLHREVVLYTTQAGVSRRVKYLLTLPQAELSQVHPECPLDGWQMASKKHAEEKRPLE